MKRYLIIAAGGGYDILTAHLLAWQLRLATNTEFDLVGMLNPKFQHFYFKDNSLKIIKESSVISLSGKKATRFKTYPTYLENYKDYSYEFCKEHFKERDFMDTRLLANSEFKLFNFSLRYSPEEQVQFMLKYDKVVICDVGGDILYSGHENMEIKTPIIDAYALMLARFYIERGGNCDLFIISPGSDRELTKEHLLENLLNVNSVRMEINLHLANKLRDLFFRVRIGDSGKTIIRMLQAVGLYSDLNEKDCGYLEKEIHQCNIYKAIELNPLSKQNNVAEIVSLYNKLSISG